MYDNCNWFQQVKQWSGELLHNLDLLFKTEHPVAWKLKVPGPLIWNLELGHKSYYFQLEI